MKKQKRQLVILLAVLVITPLLLVILAGAVPGVRYFMEKREAKEAQEAAEQKGDVIIDAAYEDVVKFSYDYEGVNYTFEKEEESWRIAEDHTLNLKEYSIKNILSGVTPLTARQNIEDVTDLGQYGLDQPERTITLDTGSASYILYVGDHNTLTGTYYVSMPSEARVYVVEQTVITRFNQTYEDVTEEAEEESGEDTGEESDGSSAEPEASG